MFVVATPQPIASRTAEVKVAKKRNTPSKMSEVRLTEQSKNRL